jgi:hypothetical protein
MNVGVGTSLSLMVKHGAFVGWDDERSKRCACLLKVADSSLGGSSKSSFRYDLLLAERGRIT